MSTELAIQPDTGISLFDKGLFEQMGLIAQKLAQSSLIPDSLKGKTEEQTTANCFRVVEQAQRWGLSPFAVMDSASVVHGKLMWEGKLIHAAITASLGVRLKFDYEGEGDHRKVTVTGTVDEEVLAIEGTVKDWKTTGKGSPWDNLANRDQMLAYRGARQWARRHAPEVILGVYSPDEMDEGQIRNVTPTTKARVKVSPTADFTTPEIVTKEAPEPQSQPPEEPEAEPPKPQKERPPGKLIRATFLEKSTKKGVTDGKSWTRYGFNLSLGDKAFWAGTFSGSIGSLGFAPGTEVLIIVEKKGEHYELLWIEEDPAQGGEEGIA